MVTNDNLHDHDHDHDCDCGCHDHSFNEEYEEKEVIVLTLEDGSVLECDVIGVFDSGEQEYIALIDRSRDSDLVLIYRFIEDESLEEGFMLENIEDDSEYEQVTSTFSEFFIDEDEE